jgi:SPP1 gp7 family putative phage head morphogenesis protein
MSNYWQDREAKQRLRYQNKTEKEIERELAKLYRTTAKKVVGDIEALYPSLLEDDALASYYYRYKKYYKLLESVNKELTLLGKSEIKILEKKLENMYSYSAMKTLKGLNYSVSNKKELENVIKSLWGNRTSWSKDVWCKDGLSGSQRVAKAMTKLQNQLERGMSDCVLRGASKDELVKTLQQRFDVSFSEANRVARTELTYIQNQATKDSFRKAGITEYEFLAEDDDRISEFCEDLNGQIFPLDAAIVGINYPPMHPNCRSTVLAVID